MRGRLLALDKDPEAVIHAESLTADPRFEIHQGSFTRMGELVARRGWTGRVSGVLLDLGLSSPQVDDPGRGFSFLRDGPLDMRMDPTVGISAAQWLAAAEAPEIARVLKEYGEERFARRIAAAIVRAREAAELRTTSQLAQVVADANPRWEKNKHPATRSFQAIRIHVNRELEDLAQILEQSLEVLAVGGRLVVISFHSLEDRVVKQFIRRQHRGEPVPASVPIMGEGINRRLQPVGKAVKPTAAEIDANPRARSAVMRVAQKVA
jgi:16S rRNA (cytosine1402-N4)-methyltransferase